MKSTSETPLMRQYRTIKQKHADMVLLFRLGDFYETFGDDAVTTAKACGITLTKRNNGAAGDIPLAGFPHHQLDTYLPKLVAAGHRVAVCEQLEDPKLAKGLVKRDVVEVVTPGVVLYDKILDASANTFLACLVAPAKDNQPWGLAVMDVSTGSFTAGDVPAEKIASLLDAFRPAEILVSKDQREHWEPLINRLGRAPSVSRLEPWHFDFDTAQRTIQQHFDAASLKGFGIDTHVRGVIAAGVALGYVGDSQRGALGQITSLQTLRSDDVMVLDPATRRNLEISSTMTGQSANGALVGFIDKTSTPMGARLLRWWVQTPLTDKARIERRHSVVTGLVDDHDRRSQLQELLSGIGDVERLLTKVMTNRANARDLGALRRGLLIVPDVVALAEAVASESVRSLVRGIDAHVTVCDLLSRALVDEPPVAVGTGGMFRSGFNAELDDVAQALVNGKDWIAQYQQRERERTGIQTLKIGFTSVFGYYIEVSNANSARVPQEYDRRQTLANAERYTTTELKQLEERILSAEDRVRTLETALLAEVRQQVAAFGESIQQTAQKIAVLDVLAGFASVAVEHEYCRPVIHDGSLLELVGARHPVIERLLGPGQRYVANDVTLDSDDRQIQIVTGPNMSGKSSYLRQVGLTVFLAHIGSYVPCAAAKVPLTDRIFTRVGAQDNILAGESTFLVEMHESANILHNATRRSLILLDEVGRGTATYDGISIAWAIAQYLHERVGAKTIFATHYHELTELEQKFDRIHNVHVEVREVQDDILFTHRVVAGSSDHSFGIHVARMAGMPAEVISTSRRILQNLELMHQGKEQARLARTDAPAASQPMQATLFTVQDDELRRSIRDLDLENMTPLQALHTLHEIQRRTNE
ncbi:MAG: DNA mismatch repair protein MutS [Candidatus Kapabacteria bacterium]|nr:DNA mismatch repair protein MutS [Candidatus Kapabacteria bacterium]